MHRTVDSLWENLPTGPPIERDAAQSKRPEVQQPAPTQQPMRAGVKPAQQRNPNGDQKKVRRQMTRQSATSTSTSSSTPSSMTEENAMTAQPTEADLLTRLAAATTLAEQTDLAAQIDALRGTQRESAAAGSMLDWEAMGEAPPSRYQAMAEYLAASDTLPPASASVRLGHTDATDWLEEISPSHTEDQVLSAQVRASATRWYTEDVWEPVKQEPQEFSVQARSAARRAGTAYGAQAPEATSVFLDQVKHLASRDNLYLVTAEWGTDPYDQPPPKGGIETYVSDGKTTLPVGKHPGEVDTFDDDTLPGPSGPADPKTTPGAGEAKSLAEGDQPEHGGSEPAENPLTGQDSDKSTYDTGEPSDRMNTQKGSAYLPAHIAAPYGGGSPKEGDTATCHKGDGNIQFFDGQWMHLKGGGSHNDVYPATPKEQADKEKAKNAHLRTAVSLSNVGIDSSGNGTGTDPSGKKVTFRLSEKDRADLKAVLYSDLAMNFSGVDVEQGDIITSTGSTGSMFEAAADLALFSASTGIETYSGWGQHTSAPVESPRDHETRGAPYPSDRGLGVGIEEGDAPEHGHGEPTVKSPEPAQDKSKGGNDPDSLPTGGTTSGNPAKSGPMAGTPTASLSANARTFLATLRRMGSLDQEVAGVSGYQIIGFLLGDETVPEPMKQTLREGARRGNDFSISDAKNEEGEWTMSPEQIRSEMAYQDEEDPDDFYESSKKTPPGGRAPFAREAVQHTAARPLYEIASEIKRDWKNVYFGAKPYLDAMSQLSSMSDRFYEDDASTVVAYFLTNTRGWTGENAKRIKAELKAMQAEHRKTRRGSVQGAKYPDDLYGKGTPYTGAKCPRCGKPGEPEDNGSVCMNTQCENFGRRIKQSSRTAGATCSVCGDAIEKDPSGENPSTWHHANGEKHDHEAKPGGNSDGDGGDGKESSLTRTASWYCTTHDVYVGDGNRDTHTRDSCNLEQRKSKGSSLLTRVAANIHLVAEDMASLEDDDCVVCGDKIAKDPSGESPSTWHHDNGHKHDHEAKPGEQSSLRHQGATEGPWKNQVAGIGENVWSENSLRFATEQEAEDNLTDLSRRWFGFDLGRVVPSDTPNKSPVDLDDPKITHNFRTGSLKTAAQWAVVTPEGKPLHGKTFDTEEEAKAHHERLKSMRGSWLVPENVHTFEVKQTDSHQAAHQGAFEVHERPDQMTGKWRVVYRNLKSKADAEAKIKARQDHQSRAADGRMYKHKVVESTLAPVTAMPSPESMGVNVGDFFYSSWGYDQTNVDFYQVVGLTGASVRVREVYQHEVDSPSGSRHPSVEYVVPDKDNFRGEVMTKRLRDIGGSPGITLNSYSGAWLWDGTPKSKTGYGYGH